MTHILSRYREVLIALVCIVVFLFVLTLVIPNQTSSVAAFGLPPALMPTLVIYLCMFVAITHLILSIFKHSVGKENSNDQADLSSLLVISLTFICIMIVNYFGLTIGGPLSILILIIAMGERRIVHILSGVVSIPGLIYILLYLRSL